jgi:hypothetical protein
VDAPRLLTGRCQSHIQPDAYLPWNDHPEAGTVPQTAVSCSAKSLTLMLILASVPEWESFVKDKQDWEKQIEGTIQYKSKSKGEKMPGSI